MTDIFAGNPSDQQSAQSILATLEGAAPTQQGTKPAETTPTANPYADLLTGITAEDGRQKFSTVEDAINSIPHAQNRINELNQKLKELEQKANESNNIDDVLKRLEQQQAAKGNPPTQELDEAKLAQLLESQLTQREQQQTQKTNRTTVASSLERLYGDKAVDMYKAKAKELGTDVDTLNDLASRSPKAVLAYFNATQPFSSSPGAPDLNTAGFRQQEEVVDPMMQFRSSESELVQKWRKAVSNTKV